MTCPQRPGAYALAAGRALAVLLVWVLALPSAHAGRERFTTWASLEIDNRAAVWLIERHIAPGTLVDIAPDGAVLAAGVPFAVPGVELSRGEGLSSYEKVLRAYAMEEDPLLQRLGRTVNKIEVSAWSAVGDRDATLVEQSYRWLHQQLQHEVPRACYNAFFDIVIDSFGAGDVADIPVRVAHLREADARCQATAGPRARPQVHQFPTQALLARIARGERVVFVDVRERMEFDAGHIPGAVNHPLREITAQRVAEWRDASLVIAYCLKDFRGYEAARRIAALGGPQAGTMVPYGIVGWRQLGLPVSNQDHDDEALAALAACAKTPSDCVASD